jgi:hypothetical protein
MKPAGKRLSLGKATMSLAGKKRYWPMLRVGRVGTIAGVLVLTACLQSQDIGPATDFEWELQTPDQTFFRDRMLIGSVPLEQIHSKGLFRKSKLQTVEALVLYADMAFVPGDTTRYFAADIVLQGGEEALASANLDPDELAPFQAALRYLVKTAENIRNSERSGTQILFCGKDDWKVEFQQQGTQQRIEIYFPATNSFKEQRRELQAVQVSALADLVEATMTNLKRQGAVLPEGQ